MKPSLLKVLQPHLIAIGLFLVISVMYFSPVLSGKALEQGDIAQWLGSSKEISDYREAYGKEPLWISTMFSGMPAYQISVVYASNLIQYVNKILWLGLPGPANLLFLGMLSFYLLMITLKSDLSDRHCRCYRLCLCSFSSFPYMPDIIPKCMPLL
ncbi:MAG: hypothetical protein IPM91_12615 [Bacteroidetes bacterium]|nr:hypothetical protein [Bacteroidota bacterium]